MSSHIVNKYWEAQFHIDALYRAIDMMEGDIKMWEASAIDNLDNGKRSVSVTKNDRDGDYLIDQSDIRNPLKPDDAEKSDEENQTMDAAWFAMFGGI